MKEPFVLRAWLWVLPVCLWVLTGELRSFGQEALEPRVRRELVSFGEDVLLRGHETSREIVVVGANAVLEGAVQGDVVILFGSVEVNGEVSGNVIVLFGSANFGPAAAVARDTLVLGGVQEVDPEARIGGERIELRLGSGLPKLDRLGDWVVQGLLLGRPIPPRLEWVWPIAGIFFALYLLAAVLFPRPLAVCVRGLERRPAGSFVLGMLGWLLIGPAVFLLIVSVAGLVIIPFLAVALVAALFFGKLAIFCFTGMQLGRQLNAGWLQRPVLAVCAGLAIFAILYTIPFFGFVLWGVAALWGLGCVLLAVLGGFKREREPEFVTTPARWSGKQSGAEPLEKTDREQGSKSMTAETATLSFRRAGFWVRFAATALDGVLLIALVAWARQYMVLIWMAYHVVLWWWKGTTIGGIVLGLRVVRWDGGPIDFPVALVRGLSSVFSAVPFFLGFLWVAWDGERQSWHDRIAGTVIVRVPRGVRLV